MKRLITIFTVMGLVAVIATPTRSDPTKVLPPGGNNSPITYITQLFDGDVVVGSSAFWSISSPGVWDYYYFYAVAGDVPTIHADRLTSAMDPAMTLFFGTTNNSDGLSYWGSTQPGMTYLTWADDNNGIPHGVGGWYTDPIISGYTLPSIGYYTLAVYDFIGMGPGPTVPYDLHISGITPIPVPGALILGILGLGAAYWKLRRFA